MKSAAASVKVFVSRDSQVRSTNLAQYISNAKSEAKVLGVDWAAAYWKGVGYFVKQEHAPRGSLPRSTIPVEAWLDESFINFAKAYVVERHLVNPSESRSGHIKRLQTLRLVEDALLTLRDDANPLGIDCAALDAAASLARTHLKTGGAHRIGAELQRLADVLVRTGVLPSNCGTWVNPNKQPKNLSISVDAESDRARQKKLPNFQALYALAEIFNRNLEPSDKRCHRDIFTTSVAAILMCAPSRGQEVLRLPENLVFEATDKFGKEQMGLRLHASKGFGAYVKWVWSGMVPVAERAIGMIRAITEDGRKLARHLEDPKSKHRFYRHTNCPDVPDDQPLSKEQVCLALGFSSAGHTSSLNKNGLKQTHGAYTLQQLWDAFVLPRLAEMHPYFPYVSAADQGLGRKGGLKFSEALFCMLKYQLHLTAGASPISLWIPDLSDLNFALTGARTQKSIFERFGYRDDKGTVLRLTSHQIRHLINTEAQRVGLTDEQIAHWSGRRRVEQNAVYDHRTLEERVEQARGAIEAVQTVVALPTATESGSSHAVGQWVVNVIRNPRALTDIDGIQPQLTGLKTLYGECHHDWSFAPCEGFVKCLDCSEHSCIKGSKDAATQLMRLHALHASIAAEVANAELVADDDVDAQDWLDVQRRSLAKVQQLIGLLESEAVPDGAVIRTAKGQSPTHLQRALRGLATKALAQEAETMPAMKQLLRSLDSDLLARENFSLETTTTPGGHVNG
ncbi:hypothetical protein [Chromobacterium sp. IRSSSOUMB001]|uniref:hypothetical protein n=1 Tax=Chromobacterium sp. IRSSSOUMB001 TaxID=2927123 RepID=UPI0020BF7AE3|nr:hypothetical protein [Chromobacterium sp. IRSSSOUMB001]